jgi:cell wall-associated NlpC family hydrolase
MYRFTFLFLVIGLFLLTATPGCAAQLKMARGVSRVGYSIQVGAFAEVANAERLAAKLQGKGVEAFYFKKENGVYAVRFGDYPSRDAARKHAQKLVAEKLVGSYFIASPEAVFAPRRKDPEISSGRPPEVHRPVEPPARPAVKADGGMGAIAARTAERFVGIPYRWGGDTVVEGLDCSGFVRAVYNLCGVNIPRTSAEQYRVGDEVARSELRAGDLVFFGAATDRINHVGIYVGDGRFVHAPRRGDEIRVSSLEEKYFAERFVGARRYF